MVNEKLILLDSIEPLDFYGINNENLKLIQSYFPTLKIIERGQEIKLLGDIDIIDSFEKKYEMMVTYFQEYSKLNGDTIDKIMESEIYPFRKYDTDNEILVHGRNGKFVKAKNPNQKRMVKSINDHDLIFAIGPAGTGKTYTAVALAVRALKNKEVKKIVLTRPAVEAGENLGFLPGDLKEKLDPYLRPLYDALHDMLPQQKLMSHIEDDIIEIAPLAFMRGRTLDNAFVILDEAQNATQGQLKMFLTRMGINAKFIVTGDITQIDLPKKQLSGLLEAEKLLSSIKGIDFIYLDDKDIIRHGLVQKIVNAYNNNDKN